MANIVDILIDEQNVDMASFRDYLADRLETDIVAETLLLDDGDSSILAETYGENQVVGLKFSYPTHTAKSFIGMFSTEANFGYNFNFDGRVHRHYDETKRIWALSMSYVDWAVQYMPPGADEPSDPDDIWTRLGSCPLVLSPHDTELDTPVAVVGAPGPRDQAVYDGYRLDVVTSALTGAARLKGHVFIDDSTAGGSPLPTRGALRVRTGSADGLVAQDWDYSTGDDFHLKLRQIVTSGLVKWSFDQINDDVSYPSVLVFHNGVAEVAALAVAGGAVTYGANDSGGSGFKYLRVPNATP